MSASERFGWEHLEHAETDGAVQVTVRDPDGRIETLRIKRSLAAGLGGANNTLRSQIWQNAHLKMAIPELYERNSKRSVLEALSDTRVVFLLGARQVGKSTLARRIATNEHPATIVDLDDPVPRKATFDDPVGQRPAPAPAQG